MRRLPLAALATAAGLFLADARQAAAQFQYQRPQTNPYGRPTVQPFINLGGRSSTVGIFSVQPNQNNPLLPGFAQQPGFGGVPQGQGLQQAFQLQQTGATMSLGGVPVAPTTGHGASFVNYGHYFPPVAARFAGLGVGGAVTPTGYATPGLGQAFNPGGAPGLFGTGGATVGGRTSGVIIGVPTRNTRR